MPSALDLAKRSLVKLLDDERLDRLSARLLELRRWTDTRRVRDLRDPAVNHDWLWALSPAQGPHVPAADFATCVRLRLGDPRQDTHKDVCLQQRLRHALDDHLSNRASCLEGR